MRTTPHAKLRRRCHSVGALVRVNATVYSRDAAAVTNRFATTHGLYARLSYEAIVKPIHADALNRNEACATHNSAPREQPSIRSSTYACMYIKDRAVRTALPTHE